MRVKSGKMELVRKFLFLLLGILQNSSTFADRMSVRSGK